MTAVECEMIDEEDLVEVMQEPVAAVEEKMPEPAVVEESESF